jgi:hypothetical protein
MAKKIEDPIRGTAENPLTFAEADGDPRLQPYCRVKWPDGGWLYWDWTSDKWLHVEDEIPRAAQARGATTVEDGAEARRQETGGSS